MRTSFILHWLLRLILAFILAVGIGYLPYKAYGPNGVARALRLEVELRQLLAGNRTLRLENQQLQQEIQQLKEDHANIEHVARDELGLVRPEDVVFQFE